MSAMEGAMRTEPTALGLHARLLAEPCLWSWEIVDRGGDGAVLYSSWANEWSAYESREEALRAGEARLADLRRAA